MIEAFNDVKRPALPQKKGIGGNPYLSNLLSLQIGHGATTMKSNRQGLWLGAKKYTDAPFSVDMAGNVVADSISLSGYIPTGGALNDIGALNITETYIANDSISTPKLQANSVESNKIAALAVTADKVSANAITAAKIVAGAVTASKIDVSLLSAISANLGNVVVGGSGDTLGTIIVKNSSGTEIAKLNQNGIIIRNTRGLFFEQTTSGRYWDLSVNASNQAVMSLPNTNQFFIKDFAGTTNLFTVSSTAVFSNKNFSVNGAISCKDLYLNYSQNEGSIRNADRIEGYNDLRLYCSGQDDVIKFYSLAGGGDLTMFPYYGDIWATGTKHFRIKHPDHPKDGWIQYTSVESPEVALKIRGVAKLVNGEVLIELPRHWELVTEEFLTTVSLTPLEDCNGLFAPKGYLSNTSFLVKELMAGNSNAEFSWELTATRKGYSNFNPEQTLDDDAKRAVDTIIEIENNPPKKRDSKKVRRDKMDALIAKKYKEVTGKDLSNDK